MAETFANNATGNLNAGITNVATSLVLQAGQGAAFPTSGNFRIVIGTEIIIAGARSGDTLSGLTRGAESTAAAAHNAGDLVTHELTAGAVGQLLQTGTAPGALLDYTEVTTTQTSTATTAATATAIITGGSVTYDGATAVWIEFQCGQVWHSVANTRVIFELYDGATDLGNIGLAKSPSATDGSAFSGRRKVTPSAAAHTFSIRMWGAAAGTCSAEAGAGGASNPSPIYLKITRA